MTDLSARAEAFARAAHDGQQRKGAAREPYVQHLAEVAGFVARHGGGDVAQAVAWLHDTVEDRGVTGADLAAAFGDEVAAAVAELTDDKRLPKPERKAQQIRHAAGKSPVAALVKLGDKWSNIRAVGLSPPEHWPLDRCRAYLDWGAEVVARLPPLPAAARAEFDATLADSRARIDAREA